MKKIYSLLLIIFLIILGIFFIYSLKEKKTFIVVGTETPPFEYYDENQWVGINIEFLEKIFSKLNIEYKIIFMDWSDALKEMENGKADMILGAGYSESREKFISYREEHKTEKIPEDALWISGEIYFYKKELEDNYDTSSYETIAENQYTVGIVRDYIYFEELFDQNLDFYVYPNLKELIIGLDNQEINLAIIDALEGNSLISKLNLTNKIVSKGQPLDVGSNLLLFQKKYDQPKYAPIKEQFYEELIRLKNEENLHETLYEKYTEINFSETYKNFL